jgi:hypothetical protein
MKKALVVLLALAVVASGFAQPVADVNVAEFSGNASVTWGVDLDAEKTGFKNETEAKVVVNIFDAAEQSTEGDGIWAELVIKTDALKIVNEGKEGKFDTGDDGIRIDTAKLHLGPAYLGILADNTKIGAFDAPEAVRQQYGIDDVGPNRVPGVVLGADFGVVSVDVDFRNAGFNFDEDGALAPNDPEADPADQTFDGPDGQYFDHYAIRAKVGINVVENLDLNVGFAYAFDEEDSYSVVAGDISQKGFGANVAYKLAIGDEFYLKPGVGYTNKLETDDKGQLAFGVLFGFDKGDTGDDEIGLPYFESADTDKGTSGVSVSTELNLNDDPMVIPLAVGFYSGEIVENLTAAALFTTENVEKVSDNYKFKAALKYAAAVGDGTITPRFGVQNAKDELELTIGAEFAGFVDNTTFDAVWESRNLSADPAGKGTFNVSIKIAL